ncbi:uncharacterized protein FMAN_15414 [Fusarium mangiferae]|uniref:Uncharacterized protein n=1 Tax=Fusarium mangiferae TaxID=192010 RepID=A0A1L7UNJ4_FUSMA|nr:uncharacterized protein FMAN_15414 [Fusarium mangiferae]CVL09071.1 uncharacterized protein FMAN_15414 [Fusarium mangiferae]
MSIVKGTSTLEPSEAQSEHELQILAINFLSLKFKLCYNRQSVRPLYSSTLQSMKKSTLRDFVANIRDDIYSDMKARPQNRETSNHELSLNFSELSQERRCPQNTRFEKMYFEQQAKGNHKAEGVLRELNQSLNLQVDDYSTDLPLQLIAATGIHLSQHCRVLYFDMNSSLPRDCWLIWDRLERLKGALDADTSPQSRWSDLSPRIGQPPSCPPPGSPLALPPTPPQSPPQQQMSKFLSSMQRIEEKVLDIHLGQTKQPAVLVQNDIGYGGIILSLACLRRLLLPDETITTLIEESKQESMLMFILRQIHNLRQLLGLPPMGVDSSVMNLQDYTIEIYNRYCEIHGDIIPIMCLPEREDSLPFILACLDQRTPASLGLANRWKVMSTELAIIFGFFLGCEKRYAFPLHAQKNILLIGTGIARGMYQRPSPANAPTYQASTMQHPTQQSLESDTGSCVDMEDHYQQSWDAQSELESDVNADAQSPSSTLLPVKLSSPGLRSYSQH